MNSIQEHNIHTNGTRFVKFCSWTLESCLLWHILHSFLLYFEKHMTGFRASLNVALEWYITFLTKQWCKALKGGTHSIQYLWKKGPEPTSSLTFHNICLVGKAHVTAMKLNLNFFPSWLQIPQISFCIFWKPVICTNLITCSVKLSLHCSWACSIIFVILGLRLCLQFNSISYFNDVT